MINKITLNKVTSFKSSSSLETDKKINLIYGLNGTGKSTISKFLQKTDDLDYQNCKIDGLTDDYEIIVYNQKFIQENFFEAESLNGIFTLSKQNKDAETKINVAEKQVEKIVSEIILKQKENEEIENDLILKRDEVKIKVWEIKKKYTGGDRVLDFCFEGFKSDGLKLLTHVEKIRKPATQPLFTAEAIKEELQALTGDNSEKYSLLQKINFDQQKIEQANIFEKQIVGNRNSSVFALIDKMGSSPSGASLPTDDLLPYSISRFATGIMETYP